MDEFGVNIGLHWTQSGLREMIAEAERELNRLRAQAASGGAGTTAGAAGAAGAGAETERTAARRSRGTTEAALGAETAAVEESAAATAAAAAFRRSQTATAQAIEAELLAADAQYIESTVAAAKARQLAAARITVAGAGEKYQGLNAEETIARAAVLKRAQADQARAAAAKAVTDDDIAAMARTRAASAKLNASINQRERAILREATRSGELGGTRTQRFLTMLSPRPTVPTEQPKIGQLFGEKGLRSLSYAAAGLGTGALLFGIADLAKDASQLESTFVKLRGQLDAIGQGDQFDSIRSQIKDISTATGQSAVDVTTYAQRLIGIYGQDTPKALEETTAAMKLMVVTGIDLKTGMESIVPITQAFGISTEELGDIAVGVADHFGVAGEDFVSFAGKAAVVSKQAGLSLRELSIIAGNMGHELGVSMEVSAETFNKMPELIQRNSSAIYAILRQGGPEAQKAVAKIQDAFKAGKPGQAVIELLGASRFTAEQGGLTENQKNQLAGEIAVNREVEQGTAIMKSAAATFRDLSNAQLLAGDSAGKLEERNKTLQGTAQRTFERVGRSLEALSESIYSSGLAGALAGIGTVIEALVGVLNIFVRVLGAVNDATKIDWFFLQVPDGVLSSFVKFVVIAAVVAKALKLLNSFRKTGKILGTEAEDRDAASRGRVADAAASAALQIERQTGARTTGIPVAMRSAEAENADAAARTRRSLADVQRTQTRVREASAAAAEAAAAAAYGAGPRAIGAGPAPRLGPGGAAPPGIGPAAAIPLGPAAADRARAATQGTALVVQETEATVRLAAARLASARAAEAEAGAIAAALPITLGVAESARAEALARSLALTTLETEATNSLAAARLASTRAAAASLGFVGAESSAAKLATARMASQRAEAASLGFVGAESSTARLVATQLAMQRQVAGQAALGPATPERLGRARGLPAGPTGQAQLGAGPIPLGATGAAESARAQALARSLALTTLETEATNSLAAARMASTRAAAASLGFVGAERNAAKLATARMASERAGAASLGFVGESSTARLVATQLAMQRQVAGQLALAVGAPERLGKARGLPAGATGQAQLGAGPVPLGATAADRARAAARANAITTREADLTDRLGRSRRALGAQAEGDIGRTSRLRSAMNNAATATGNATRSFGRFATRGAALPGLFDRMTSKVPLTPEPGVIPRYKQGVIGGTGAWRGLYGGRYLKSSIVDEIATGAGRTVTGGKAGGWKPQAGQGFAAAGMVIAGGAIVKQAYDSQRTEVEAAANDLSERMNKATTEQLEAVAATGTSLVERFALRFFGQELPETIANIKVAERHAAPTKELTTALAKSEPSLEQFSQQISDANLAQLNEFANQSSDAVIATFEAGGTLDLTKGRHSKERVAITRENLPAIMKRAEAIASGAVEGNKDWANEIKAGVGGILAGQKSLVELREKIAQLAKEGRIKELLATTGGAAEAVQLVTAGTREEYEAGKITTTEYLARLRSDREQLKSEKGPQLSEQERKELAIATAKNEQDERKVVDDLIVNRIKFTETLAELQGSSNVAGVALEARLAALPQMSYQGRLDQLPDLLGDLKKNFEEELKQIADPVERARRAAEGFTIPPEVQDLITEQQIKLNPEAEQLVANIGHILGQSFADTATWVVRIMRENKASLGQAIAIGLAQQMEAIAAEYRNRGEAGGEYADPRYQALQHQQARALLEVGGEKGKAAADALGKLEGKSAEYEALMIATLAQQMGITPEEAYKLSLELGKNEAERKANLDGVITAEEQKKIDEYNRLIAEAPGMFAGTPVSGAPGVGQAQPGTETARGTLEATAAKRKLDAATRSSMEPRNKLLKAQSDVDSALADVALERAAIAENAGGDTHKLQEAENRLRESQVGLEDAHRDIEDAQLDWAEILAGDDPEGQRLGRLEKAKVALRRALADRDPAGIIRAQQDLFKLEREDAKGQQELIKSRLDVQAAIFERDPVKAAQIALQQAELAEANAEGEVAKNNAAAARIRAQHGLEDAISNVIESQANLAIAIADAAGDSVRSAELAAQEAERKLNDAIAQGRGQAEINQLTGALTTANANLFRTRLSEEQETIDFMRDMGQITLEQALNAYRALLSRTTEGTDEYRNLMRAIKSMEDQASADYQFNLPTTLGLPTAYEARRVTQTMAQGLGYQDNRNVAVIVNVNGAQDPMTITNQIVAAFQGATNSAPIYTPQVGVG